MFITPITKIIKGNPDIYRTIKALIDKRINVIYIEGDLTAMLRERFSNNKRCVYFLLEDENITCERVFAVIRKKHNGCVNVINESIDDIAVQIALKDTTIFIEPIKNYNNKVICMQDAGILLKGKPNHLLTANINIPFAIIKE